MTKNENTEKYLNYNVIPICMARDFNVIIEKGQDGYLISEVVELPGCHTQAKTMDELLRRTKEAIKLYLKSEENEAIELHSQFLGVQKIAV